MKTLNLIISLILISIGVQAQGILNDKELLKNELDSTISKQKIALNSIEISPAGDWIIFFGDYGYSFVRTSAKISKLLEENNSHKNYLKDIDFFEDAGWVLLTNHNAYKENKCPKHITSKLYQINKQRQNVKCIDFDEKGNGFILYDINKVYSKGMPKNFMDKVYQLQAHNQDIKYMAVNNKSKSWVILYANYGFACSKTPAKLNQTLQKLTKQKIILDKIFLFDKYWILTTQKSKIYSNL